MRKFVVAFCCLLATTGWAQEEDLLGLIEEEQPEKEFEQASFKTTRIVNAHSIENTHSGVLDFKISHRFGMINTGAYEFFGLDQATIRLGLDYGISERLMVGIGRSSWNKTIDGFAKYKILRQTTKASQKQMPISLTWFSGMYVNTLKWADPDRDNKESSRLDYAHQLLIARKFSEGFTAQLMPSLVHRNLVPTKDENNDVFAIGAAVRQKVTKRVSVNAEYFYVLPDQIPDTYENSLSLGVDIETGGHVFQLHITNSTPMTENGYIPQTTGDFFDGDIHFGFNVSRVFTIVKPKEFRDP